MNKANNILYTLILIAFSVIVYTTLLAMDVRLAINASQELHQQDSAESMRLQSDTPIPYFEHRLDAMERKLNELTLIIEKQNNLLAHASSDYSAQVSPTQSTDDHANAPTTSAGIQVSKAELFSMLNSQDVSFRELVETPAFINLPKQERAQVLEEVNRRLNAGELDFDSFSKGLERQ